MAHHAGGQHWWDLGKSKSLDLPDKSTGAILKSLVTPRDPKVTMAHAGVASVSTDGGKRPMQHACDDGPNAAANAEFNATASQPPRMSARPDQLVAAGITGPAKYGR